MIPSTNNNFARQVGGVDVVCMAADRRFALLIITDSATGKPAEVVVLAREVAPLIAALQQLAAYMQEGQATPSASPPAAGSTAFQR